MTSSVIPVSDGSLEKAPGPLPAPSTATGQAAGAQEGNPEGGTVTEGPPVSRTGLMAAATTIEVRTTVLEADQKGLKVAQPTMQTANTTRRQRPRASLAVSPELEESFYKRMAVIKNYTDDKICDTHDCFVHASLLKASLNLSVDPCHDFSAFVCSSWAMKQTQFREKVTTVMDNLRYSWYRHFGGTLRRGSLKLPVGKKPLAMYEMCLAGSSSTNGAPLMYKFVRNQLTKWNISNEDVSAVSLAVLLAYKWQAPLWLAVTILDGHRSSSGRRRVAVRPGAYLPIILTQHRVVAGAYIQYMKSFLAAYLPHDAALAWTDDEINAIRAMEGDVIGQLSSVRDQKKPALLSFGEFDAMMPNEGGLWRNFQKALTLQPQLTRQDEVILSDLRFFEILARLVATYGDTKLKFLLTWQFMQLYAPLGDLSLLTIRYGSKSRAETYRPAFCAHHVEASFKVLVLSLAVAASFTDEQCDHIDALFDGLVSAALRKVNSSTWLAEENKVRLAHKLALVNKWMWPPQSLLAEDALEKIYADVSENETSIVEFWIKTRRIMGKVNETTDYNDASRLLGNNFPLYIDYDYVFNSVNVATGVAAAPAYYRNGTAAMFYGGLGFLMAMQLVRSIDEEGLQWKAAESIVDSILSHSSRPAYEEKVRCLNESGSRSVFPEIPALEIAMSAFEETTLGGEGEHLALSPDLPEGKVFFLTICYMTCGAPGHSSPMAADCNKLVCVRGGVR
ncbi:endothelin-converting enzyme 2 [Dermacentor silvarum]|uniref:endothelin-converting enzyme 2 n=1 Tax=Dermacentor silvarum TaxID=543639 RepID=UPI00189B9F8D|nr:endothelin-converting enzyme 2 [Dermacentor silvarum]